MLPSPFDDLKMKTAHGLVMFKSFPLFTSSYSYSASVPFHITITLFSCQIQLQNAFLKKKKIISTKMEMKSSSHVLVVCGIDGKGTRKFFIELNAVNEN